MLRLMGSVFIAFTTSLAGVVDAQDASNDSSREATINKALTLLETASAGTADHRMCFTCHGQALPVMALAEAKSRGMRVDDVNLQRQLDHTEAFLKRGHKNYLSGKGQGGRIDTAGYALWTLEAGQRPPNDITDAVTEYILETDDQLERWKRSSNRPPSEASDFTTTYLAIRALAAYGTAKQQQRIDERNQKVLKWLSEARPRDTEDRVFLLRTLTYLNADEKILRRVASELIDQQRTDGGWGQKADMESDAYATGTVLVSLIRSTQLTTLSDAYQRGSQYLISTQHDDGSWRVVSRSKPFQKYFESGFPHGNDQFISTSATAWSAIALLLGVPEENRTYAEKEDPDE